MKQILRTAAALSASGVLALATIVGMPQSASATSACPTGLFNGLTPDDPNYNDPASVNVGLQFKVRSAPYITGAKFYKGVGNTGTHEAHLRLAGGSTDLASATFSSETSSGWQSVTFGTPVPASASANYVVWVSMPNGHYAVDVTGDNSLAGGAGSFEDAVYVQSGTKGLYDYTSTAGAMPTSTTAFNYWVSPVVADTTNPVNVTSLTAVDDTAGPIVDWNAASYDANSSETGNTVYNEVLRTQGSNTVRVGKIDGSGATYWPGLATLTQKDVTAVPGTTYTYSVSSVDACGNSSSTSASSMTTASQSLEKLFSTDPTDVDTVTAPTTVGMHWQSAVSGSVWGARIYRAPGTAPSIVTNAAQSIKAMLWDNNGTLLASQYLPSGDAQSGWIDIRFNAPVSVSANHDYVIGYYSGNGQETYTTNVFTSPVSNGNNLTAPADSSETPNAVYSQDESTGHNTFPTERSNDATWYGVDVDFIED